MWFVPWSFLTEPISCLLDESVHIALVYQEKNSCLLMKRNKGNHSIGCSCLLYFPPSFGDPIKRQLLRWLVSPRVVLGSVNICIHTQQYFSILPVHSSLIQILLLFQNQILKNVSIL